MKPSGKPKVTIHFIIRFHFRNRSEIFIQFQNYKQSTCICFKVFQNLYFLVKSKLIQWDYGFIDIWKLMDTYVSIFKQTGCHDDAVNPFLPHHVPEWRNCLLLGSYNMGTINMHVYQTQTLLGALKVKSITVIMNLCFVYWGFISMSWPQFSLILVKTQF